MENEKTLVISRLRRITRNCMTFTSYAERRAAFRQIDLEDVYDNLLNPVRLQRAERQIINGEERFNCYFVYKRRALRCVLVFVGDSLKIINVIKQRKWPL